MTKIEKAARLAETWATSFENDAGKAFDQARAARGDANAFSPGADPGAMHVAIAADLRGRAAVLRNLAYAIRTL